jgi:hypothetical protein
MKKFTMLLFLSLLLAQVAFTQTVDVIYTVNREASPTALPAEGASISITYTNGANPAVTETKTADALGTATFTVPLPATGTNYRLVETITLAGHNPFISTSSNGTRITEYTSSQYNAYKFLGLTNTTLFVSVRKDDANNGPLIEGASVTFTCANPVINTTIVTGADGIASIPVVRDLAANYTITIAIAPIAGYAAFANTTQSIPYMPSSGLTTKTLAMMWLYPVKLTVTNSTGTPIEGASVKLTGTPTSVEQFTDANGKTSFTKQKLNSYGYITHTIAAAGYADSVANIMYSTFVDPLDLTIKLRNAYSINFTVTDAAVAPVSAAVVTIKPKNSAIAATTLNTAADGKITFPKKTNGIYTYMISKVGYADVAGELTVNDADNNQAITLQAGYDFTFYIKNGTANLKDDSVTINGITKVSPTNGTIVFGLPAGTHDYSNTKVAWVKELGSIVVDPANLILNNKTLNLVPIYSLKVVTKNELSQVVPYSFVLFNGNTYQTDATGTVIITNIAPKGATERQYYDLRVMKDGYGEYSDSIKCGLVAATNLTRNMIVRDANYILFSKPRIDINYAPSMNFANLSINGVDRSSSITYMGGGMIQDAAPGIYNYYMTYQTPGFAPARGSVEVKPNQNARIVVQFVKGYDIQFYTLDSDNNPVEGAYVTMDDTTMKTGVDGDVLFKMRREKTTYTYTAYQKDGSGKIIAKAKGQVILGTVPITGEIIHLIPVADSILVNVMDIALWEPIPGAIVKCDNESFVTDAQGIAVIPVTADSAAYTFTTSSTGYFDQTTTVIVDSANVTEFVYMNKQYSASFSVNDGTNPIEGAIIKIEGIGDAITSTAGTASFTKVLKKSWDAYNFTVSVPGYPDYIGTFYVSNGDVIVDPVSFTTKAYDVTLTVNKPNGTPAPYAQVTFNDAVYTTNALGMLSATKVINGSYPIVISLPGYIDYPATVTVADANVNQTITLTGGFDLTVQVINGSTGIVGLANTSITINGITKITGADGIAIFGVPANYAVNTVVTKAGFVDAPLVIADVNANMTSTVYMTPVYNVNIRVMDNNSYNPIQGATVVFSGETKLSDVDGFARFMNVDPSATAYEYSVTGPGTYNSSNGTIELPFSSPAEYIETANEVSINVGLTSPYVYIALTDGWMNYFGAATITFDGVDYEYNAGLGGNMFNCELGTHTYVVTPANEAKAILRGTVVLTESEPTANVWLDVVNGRKVEIYVVDKNNEPIEGAEVVLNGLTITTDASGAAIYNRTVPGEYTYAVTKTGYISQTNPISVNTADVLELVTLLMPEYSATFTVTDGTLNLEGASVTIGTATVASDVDGKAVITGLNAGTYDYSVVKAGYVTETGTVTVVDANITENVILVLKKYSITFNVTDGTSAIANALVTVGMNTVLTGVDGKAVFTDMLPAAYDYMVTADGYDTISSSVAVVDADVEENVTMILTVYTLTFNVSDGAAALAGADVTVGTTTIATGADGKAVFTDLLPGNYNYSVSKTGYVTRTGSVSVVNVDVAESVTMVLSTYAILFNVTDGSAAISGAEVKIGTSTVVTGADGKALFTGLLPGEYAYTVMASGYGHKAGSVTITDADVIMDLTLLSDVGLNLSRNGAINVYPNPTKGNLSVNLPANSGKGITISVTNAIGKVVLQNKVVDSSTGLDLDLSGFDNGVYFVKVIGNGFQNTVKVVKN